MIFFNVPEARQQLLDKGFVYTLRPRHRSEGQDIAATGSYYNWKKIADVQIEFIKEIGDIRELEEYVSGSGFDNIYEWKQAAKGDRLFLFRVRLIS